MKAMLNLTNGVYHVTNGDDCDNYPYYGLLVIYDGQAWFSGWQTGSSLFGPLEQVTVPPESDIATVLGIKELHWRA